MFLLPLANKNLRRMPTSAAYQVAELFSSDALEAFKTLVCFRWACKTFSDRRQASRNIVQTRWISRSEQRDHGVELPITRPRQSLSSRRLRGSSAGPVVANMMGRGFPDELPSRSAQRVSGRGRHALGLERGLGVPRHPRCRVGVDRRCVPLELGEILEEVGLDPFLSELGAKPHPELDHGSATVLAVKV